MTIKHQLPAVGLSLALALFAAGIASAEVAVEEKTTTTVGPAAVEKSTTTVAPGAIENTTTTVAPAAVEKTTTTVGPDGVKSSTSVTPAVEKTTTTTVAPTDVGKSVSIRKSTAVTPAQPIKAEDYWKSLTRNRKIVFLESNLSIPTDTVETATTVFLTAEVPGLDESCLDVIVGKDTVTLKADKKIDTLQKADDYRRIERSYGKLEKTIALPATVDSELSTASLKNGLLTLILPKAPASNNEGKKLVIKTD